jgi:hypothetical protein
MEIEGLKGAIYIVVEDDGAGLSSPIMAHTDGAVVRAWAKERHRQHTRHKTGVEVYVQTWVNTVLDEEQLVEGIN